MPLVTQLESCQGETQTQQGLEKIMVLRLKTEDILAIDLTTAGNRQSIRCGQAEPRCSQARPLPAAGLDLRTTQSQGDLAVCWNQVTHPRSGGSTFPSARAPMPGARSRRVCQQRLLPARTEESSRVA